MRPAQTRTYDRASSIVFLKTDAPFGGLSNMAGGFPLWVNGNRILTSEALYQSCRFPHRPEVQALVIEQKSPMTAKMKSKPYRHDSRPDWDQVRVKIMRWCLRVKLAQNWLTFSELLLKTGERPIVEESRKDAFWGAKATGDGTLVGMNVLGRLLMELREAIKVESRESLSQVKPLAIADFLLGGQPIEIVASQAFEHEVVPGKPAATRDRSDTGGRAHKQPSLFDAPAHPYQTGSAKSGYVADLKPYTEYKESGLPWLGKVPGHWGVLPNRALFAEVKDRDHPDEEMLSVTITRGIVKQKVLLEGSSKKDSSNLDKSAYKLVQPRDIAYNKMRAWQGAIGASALRGIISPAYVVMRLRNADDLPSYFHHLYRTPQFAKEAERWSYGITSDMWSLRPEHFKLIYTPQPPLDEQAAIVRFLDWANGRLERAIRAKRKVTALLNEQKQAIIHRAVTRGLDPSVPLKPSGIPWLGDIPEHWELRRLKSLCKFVTSGSRGWARYYADAGFVFLRIGNISTASVDLKLKRITYVTPPSGTEGERTRAIANDILLSITAQIGAVGVVPDGLGDAFVNQHTALIRLRPQLTVPRWIAYGLLSQFGKDQCRLMTNGGTKVGLTLNDVRCLLVLLPPPEEQVSLVAGIESRTRELDVAISRLEREIDLLREYRTRLVTDVVTGKLDVREAAARLSDEEPLNTGADDADLNDEIEAADEEAAV